MKKLLIALCFIMLCSIAASAQNGSATITFTSYSSGNPDDGLPTLFPPPGPRVYYFIGSGSGSGSLEYYSAPLAILVQMEVYSSNGVLVYSKTEYVSAGSNTTIDTTGWAPGKYTLIVTKPGNGGTQWFYITI